MPKVTKKGQVTIPRHIRAIMRIQTGDQVDFGIENNRVFVAKRAPAIEKFKDYIGFLSHLEGKTPDETVQELRGPADDSRG